MKPCYFSYKIRQKGRKTKIILLSSFLILNFFVPLHHNFREMAANRVFGSSIFPLFLHYLLLVKHT